MRRRRQPDRTANDLLRQAIRQVSAAPLLTGSLLLAFAPASRAITLGDVNVQSALGQRLNATVPVRLEAGESLAAGCVTASQQTGDLRPVPDLGLSVPDATRAGLYELRLTSAEALYEPMYALELEVQCPGTPILVRQYVLMLDLPGAVATGAAAAPAALAAPDVPAASESGSTTSASADFQGAPSAQPTVTRARPAGRIESGTTYRVAEGDTLSGIAARIAGRNGSLQAVADTIQAANPAAFIRNDPNLIKLGSEIVIPAAFGQPASAPEAAAANLAVPAVTAETPMPPAVPAPALPPALEQVPAAPEPAPVAAAPALPDRVAAPAPTQAQAQATADAADAAPVATDEPNPFLAAGAGIVFGLVVSTLLWFRGRSPARKSADGAMGEHKSPAPVAAAVATVAQRAEPGLSVSYTPAEEDALAAEFDEPGTAPGEDITSELEELFDSTDTTIQKRLAAEKTVAARTLVPDPEGYAPPDVDFLVGDATAEQPIPPGSTVEQPRPNLEPTVDLRTLASSATGDEQQAQTLLEALTLLERDYEEELTASQVLDMSAVREALGEDFDEPTQVREARLKDAASGKKKS